MDAKNLKFGQVLKCEFNSEWLNPINKKIIYFHDVTTDIGDTARCGTVEKNSPRIKKGVFIEYEIDDNGKMKLHESSADKGSMLAPGSDKLVKAPRKESTTSRIKGQEGFLGYAWSYAKDFIIAGKTMKDVEELNKVARYIYNEMGKMLMNDEQKPE